MRLVTTCGSCEPALALDDVGAHNPADPARASQISRRLVSCPVHVVLAQQRLAHFRASLTCADLRLAPNIYYLGAAGSVLVNGVRISGASGIYKSHDYRKGRHEGLPYDRSTIRSTYHTRQYDIERLKALPLVGARPTIVLSHDWPLEIERYGDTGALIRKKPFFKDEVREPRPAFNICRTLTPLCLFGMRADRLKYPRLPASPRPARDATSAVLVRRAPLSLIHI